MKDSNYIKGQFSSWKQCINWLEVRYPGKKMELEHKLRNVRSISYESSPGLSSISESMRRSMVIDEINNLEQEKKYCESVIQYCELTVKKIKPEYQSIFIDRYQRQVSISSIAYKTSYDTQTIYKICDRETARLTNQ